MPLPVFFIFDRLVVCVAYSRFSVSIVRFLSVAAAGYVDILPLYYTLLEKTFNTFKKFYAVPAKKNPQYSLRVFQQSSPVPHTQS
jgi:hypothetical protein